MKLAGLKSVDGAHEESIWAAAWAPATDHRPTAVLLTGALDETVRAWRPDDLAALGPPARGHALGVVSLAAHPTGARAAEVLLDSFAHVFDVDSGGLATLEAAPSKVWAVQFHPKVSTEHGCPTPVVRNQDFQGKKNGCFLAIFAAIMLDGSMGNEPNV